MMQHAVGTAASQPQLVVRSSSPDAEAGVQHTSWEDLAELVPLMRISNVDTVVDIGCGDGRVVIMAVNAHGCRGIGVENDSRLVELARQNVERTGLSSAVTIYQANAENWAGYENAIVYCYLWTDLLEKLSPRLVSAKRVVSYQHPIPNLPMYDVILKSGGKAYVYERNYRK